MLHTTRYNPTTAAADAAVIKVEAVQKWEREVDWLQRQQQQQREGGAEQSSLITSLG